MYIIACSTGNHQQTKQDETDKYKFQYAEKTR